MIHINIKCRLLQAVASQPTSEFSEIQPASSSEDVSGQTVFATPYKNTAISKLMAETKGPSTTVPAVTENSQSAQNPATSQQPQRSEPEVEQSAPPLTSEKVQSVAGYDNSSEAVPAQGQNMATGGFRSSSGVPSEDELAQLYSNELGGAQVGVPIVSRH